MGMIYSVFASIFGGGGEVEDSTPDPVTGLTQAEVRAITDSWAVIAEKKAVRVNGVEFFVMLFNEYPYMQDSFADFKNMTPAVMRKDKTMYAHALTVMYSIGSMVDNLQDSEQLCLIIDKMAHNHVAREVGFRYFKDLADMFPKFLEAMAGSSCTPLIKESWHKFLSLLAVLVQQKAEEEERRS